MLTQIANIAFCLLLFVSIVRSGERIVVIDAGHGGSKPSGSQKARTLSSPNNARSPGGLLEKDLTLELAQKVIGCLNSLPAARKAGLRAIPTRTGDVNPDFAARAKVAADQGALIFVSIHFNAVPARSAKASGTLGIVQMKSRNPHYQTDVAFASRLTKAANQAIRTWLPASRALPTGDDHELHGGMGSNLFHQLRAQMKSPITACFLEVEFMDNPAVEAAILKGNRSKVFDAVAAALAQSIVEGQ